MFQNPFSRSRRNETEDPLENNEAFPAYREAVSQPTPDLPHQQMLRELYQAMNERTNSNAAGIIGYDAVTVGPVRVPGRTPTQPPDPIITLSQGGAILQIDRSDYSFIDHDQIKPFCLALIQRLRDRRQLSASNIQHHLSEHIYSMFNNTRFMHREARPLVDQLQKICMNMFLEDATLFDEPLLVNPNIEDNHSAYNLHLNTYNHVDGIHYDHCLVLDIGNAVSLVPVFHKNPGIPIEEEHFYGLMSSFINQHIENGKAFHAFLTITPEGIKRSFVKTDAITRIGYMRTKDAMALITVRKPPMPLPSTTL